MNAVPGPFPQLFPLLPHYLFLPFCPPPSPTSLPLPPHHSTIPRFTWPGLLPARACTPPRSRRSQRARSAVRMRSGCCAPSSLCARTWVLGARLRFPGWAPCTPGSRSYMFPPARAAPLPRGRLPSSDLCREERALASARTPRSPPGHALPFRGGRRASAVLKSPKAPGDPPPPVLALQVPNPHPIP